MGRGRIVAVTALAVALVGGGASTAFASTKAGTSAKKQKATVVNVMLGDTQGLNGPMTMTITPAAVKSGSVKFVVKNTGTIVHELIVLKTTTAFDQLPVADAGDPPVPVTAGANKVDESSSVGESGNVSKGKTKSFTLKLKAGSYVLVCNIAQHYGLGMRGSLTVS
jgi:uncharacterized cupredoxin-like copper-binding protein